MKKIKHILKETIEGIKIVFRDSTSYKVALFAGLVIGYLYYWLLTKVTTIPMFFSMAKNGDFGAYSYLYAAIYWILTLSTIVSFGVSVAVLVWLWRRSRLSKVAGGANTLGAFVGALGAACPVCGAFLLSLLGITGGVAIMPFQGLELNFVSLGLMMGSTVISSRKVKQTECKECDDVPKRVNAILNRFAVLPLEKIVITILIGLFIVNQILISQVTAKSGLSSGGGGITRLFGIKTASATIVYAPKINSDGKTTTIVEQPTITEVPANPNTGDALADAKVVMIPTGKPFYAPDDISFDDPINAQNKWGAYENNITLSGTLQSRYDALISTFTCNYCCGGPNNVTTINHCGCRHAKAWRGMFKYMLQTYGDKYTDEQLKGEAYRWTGIWYPKGVLEDYLLVTGKGDVLGHQTHGGAGADGRHGL